MFEFIIGKVVDIYENKVVLETNGIGYLISVPANTLSNLGDDSSNTRLYIHEHIREDEISLYGFSDKSEREIFRELLSVSGIGPKVSLATLSRFKVSELIRHISSEDEKALSSVPGIGKKTANRIILELKDKFKKMSHYVPSEDRSDQGESSNDTLRQDSISALVSLGYDYHQAAQLIDKSIEPNITLEQLIKKALSKINNV